jgi:hypothetical protein
MREAAGMSTNTDRAPKAPYNYVAFAVPEVPAYFDPQKPDAAAVQLAQELFGLPPTDFNQKHGGRFWGEGKFGFVFEVLIKIESSQALAVKALPQILDIYE